MKFLAFTDLHENPKILARLVEEARPDDVEFVVCCGDASTFGRGLESVFKAFSKLGKPFLFIPGNHEEDSGYEAIVRKYPFVIDLHRQIHTIGKFTFAGYGGGGFAQQDGEFRMLAQEWEEELRGKKLVLLVHMPPYKTACDNLGRHVGSKDYRTFVEVMQPVLVLCGHLHETFGTVDKIGKSIVLNPGATGKIIEFN